MTALFSIDCHACGAKNTIDAETMRRVKAVSSPVVSDEPVRTPSKPYWYQCGVLSCDCHPEPAA